MRRIYKITLILISILGLVFACTYKDKVNATTCASISDQLGWKQFQELQLLLPIVQDGRWGYINRNGKVIIPPKFDRVDFFFGGRAAYRSRNNGKWGYINTQGEIVVPAQFDKASRFFNERAAITIADKIGFIDPEGRIVVEPQFKKTTGFYRGNAFVQKDFQWQLIGIDGRRLTEDRFSYVNAFSEDLAPFMGINGTNEEGFINSSGQVVIELPRGIHPDFEGLGFANQRHRVYVRSPFYWHQYLNPPSWGKYTYGFIDNQGNQIIPPQYERVGGFSECLASVKRGGRYGVIDTNGNIIVSPKFDFIDTFSEGVAATSLNQRTGYINKTGEVAIEFQFYDADIFHEGLARVQTSQNGKWGYIDRGGNFVIDPKFDFGGSFKHGVAQVQIDNRWGYIDYTGQFIWSTTEPRPENFVY